MAQATTSSSRTIPRLRGVEVTYVDGRPVKRMDLTITVDEKEPIERKSVAQTGTIACNILCPRSSTLTIRIRKTWKVLFSKQNSSVEALLASVDTPLQDESGTVNVKLFFSGIIGTDTDDDARRRQDAADVREKVEGRHVILDKLERVRFLVDNIEPIGEALGEAHSGVKGAFVAVGLLMKVCERQEACRDAAIALTDEWEDFLSLTDSAPVLREREESRKGVQGVLGLIDEVSDYIINHTPTGNFGGLFSRKYNKKIGEFKRSLALALKSFDRRVDVDALKGIDNLENNQMLEALRPALRAHYKPGKEHMCLEGTRTSLRGKAKGWLQTPSSSAAPAPPSAGQTLPSVAQTPPSAAQTPPSTVLMPPSAMRTLPYATRTLPSAAQPRVFWLCGMGGSGKSYVANTVAADVNADTGLDLSCFFCKRDDPELSKPENFFRTLAYRIAQYYASYRVALVALLRSPEGAAIATGGVSTQYKMLFGDLLPKIQAPARSHVIVIDALDECGTPAEQAQLAECILSMAKAAPWIKVFVTSRPVDEIRNRFTSDSSMCMAANINDEDETGADIRRFIADLMDLANANKTVLSLSPEQIEQLVEQAAGLFIWPRVLFEHVKTMVDPQGALLAFLSKGTSKEPNQLDRLYSHVVDSAVGSLLKKEAGNADVLHAILGMVFISAGFQPLPVDALSLFLRADTHMPYLVDPLASVKEVTRALGSILYEDAKMHGAVRVYHPSILDFLESKLKDWFSSGIQEMHQRMFRGCLMIMDAKLDFNICQLDDSTRLNKDIPDLSDRISMYISEALRYSSLHWFSHLSKSCLEPEEVNPLVEKLLCSRKFLFWLEVLSVLGAVGQGAAILHGCVQFFEGSPDIADVISDLERFVQSSSEAMQSVPHIYLSVLTWVPEETLTQKKIAAQFKNLHWITRKEASWEGTRWVKSVGTPVRIVACSPDGRLLAAGMYDVRVLDSGTGEPAGEPLQCDGPVKSIRYSADGERVTIVTDESVTTWNVKTGATVRDPIKLNLDDIEAAAISPDGLLIACGSRSGVIVFFDARTGAVVGEQLVGHTEMIWSIAFSPDGQHVVSGYWDKTIRIWDVKTRTAVGNPLEGHGGIVTSVCYSPDGRCIASGSDDGTVRIWNAQSGAALFEPLRGHSNSVWSVACSQDGRWVASGSQDGTIRIWDPSTGMAAGAPLQGHSDGVYSVAFLPDSRHIISGSDDTTVRIWDVGFSSTSGAASEGHSHWVTSVSFSPDGERIASGSWDKTVRIWNTKTGAAIGGALEGHEDEVNSVCFSPDGLLITSVSNDQTIRFWDAVTGAEVGEPLVGHTEAVESIAFSPDGQHVVSGSRDKTIRIWDVQTRTAVGNPLKGKSGVHSVSFSPDGRCIASGSGDGRVCLWNAQTGAALFEPLRGHSSDVLSVAFSLDGRWVASGSYDETIRIWDAKTGAAIGDPLQCHSEVESVAFSPDSRRIVSGSYGVIRIWDVETRAEIADPLRVHSRWVNAVAFSPDGQHIASGSDDAVRIWDAVDHVGTDAHWDECCARLNVEDGWVKDEEKLLLWVPHRYRENFKIPRLQVCIRRGALTIIRPEVDPEKLFAYTGTGWTQVYKE